MKSHWLAGAVLASLICLPAHAASYVFNVTYSGGGVGVQGPGGDDILLSTMFVGDDFTYTLSADGAGEWKALTDNGIFPLIALPTNESADRNVDYSLTLFNNGLSVFNTSGNEDVSEVHVGTNTLSLTSGLVFDQWVLTVLINSANELGGGPETTTTASDILPVFGPADINEPSDVIYSAAGFGGAGAVPEPATWALMIGGFGIAGATLRRRKTLSFT